MPLIAWAVAAYAAGLLAGFMPAVTSAAIVVSAAVALGALPLARRGRPVPLACALLVASGACVALDSRRADAACAARAAVAREWSVARSATPCAPGAGDAWQQALESWRAHAGASIDTLFGADGPLVRALLIADRSALDPALRDRFAAAGLVHVLSISGLHVAIIAESMIVALSALRVGRNRARFGALVLTVVYVAAIGAPLPAMRSAAMLAVRTLGRVWQRPISPWAALALGAAVPLINPRNVTSLGWQLTVGGFAAITAAGIWCKRNLSADLRGWRRQLVRNLVVSTLATLVTAPLVAWTFGRVSLVAPVTNLLAAPVLAALQPALFLALLLAPFHGAAAFVADAAHPLLAALDGIASSGASVPHGAVAVAPSLVVAVSAGAAALALVVAASSRHAARPLAAASLALAAACWWPLTPVGSGELELHAIDVGQGDAIALRTPNGRWILVDAGRMWNGGDAGRSVIIPYLRRLGGDVVLFVLTHPHADHVGGAATVLRALHPLAYRDAAFAGGSTPYRLSLAAASELGIPWARVHPGETLSIDGVSVTFLAPDSTWTAHLKDPNLASTVTLVRYGDVRFLLTGDAEGPEEEWLVAHAPGLLRADVLKVAHHGSSTSTTSSFLDRVQPRVAVVSVGAGNSYGHPGADVMRSLLDRNVEVLRTDQLGTIVVRTDGRTLHVSAGGAEWTPAPARP